MQLTKMGFTFVLDRDTGKPLFPVQEIAGAAIDVPGRGNLRRRSRFRSSRRRSCARSLTEADLTNITPEAHAQALKEFRKYLSGPIFTPPSLQGTITTPGHLGGAEWHGAIFDPLLNVLYVNVNEAPTINRLRPVHDPPGDAASSPIELGTADLRPHVRRLPRRRAPGHAAAHPAARRSQADAARKSRAVITRRRNGMPAFRQFRPRETERARRVS